MPAITLSIDHDTVMVAPTSQCHVEGRNSPVASVVVLAPVMKTTLLAFGLRFALGFLILTAAFEASRGTSFERFVIEESVLLPTAKVVNTISPGVTLERARRTIISGTARLHVTRGCEGIEMLFLLAAAILAYPASLRRRTQGLLIGSVLAFTLSVGRLTALIFTLRYWPDGWEAMHGLLMPLVPIIVIAAYFLYWSTLKTASVRKDQPHAA
jgi:exosortase family protein XrtM